jgi:hypothetical protein
MYGLNKFILHIVGDYIDGIIREQPATSPQAAEFERLLKQQQSFLSGLDKMLRSAAQHEEDPNDPTMASKRQAVMAVLSGDVRFTFEEIQERSRIKEEELIILLGHMYTQGKLGYDEKWRYYLL